MKNKIKTPLKIKIISLFPFFTLFTFLFVCFGIYIAANIMTEKKIKTSNEQIASIYSAFIRNHSDNEKLIEKLDPKYMLIVQKEKQLNYILPVSIESLKNNDYVSEPERLGLYEIMSLIYTDFVKNNYRNSIKTIMINNVKINSQDMFKILSLSEKNREYYFYKYIESEKINKKAEKTTIIIEKE